MSDVKPASANRAVFLSYASQDAEAAKRVCETLRAVGVEVWFDQDALVGGDVWDQKIRGQVATCALFVPIISANTQARLEGYFRIEWKLAAQRTHAMADERAFLLPVVIDGTKDTEAKVPVEFRAVQWSRLPGGETPERFCARVKKLLGGEAAVAGSEAGARLDRAQEDGRGPATPQRQSSPAWFVPVIIGAVAIAAVAIWQPWKKSVTVPPAAPQTVPAGGEKTSPIADEVARLRARLIPEQWKKDDFEPWSAALDRMIAADDQNADAWALRSILNSLPVLRSYDAGTKPLEIGRSAANRALYLAPNSPLADLALGLHYAAMISRGGDLETAQPYLRRGLAGLPRDALTRFASLNPQYLGFDFAEVDRAAAAWLRDEPAARMPAFILALAHLARRDATEALKWGGQAASGDSDTGARAYVTVFDAHYYLRGDLVAAREALDRMPTGARDIHRAIHARWLIAMAEKRWDTALQELARTPEAIFFASSYHGPKALLAGLAQQAAGRTDAAQIQFREAEQVLRGVLAGDPQNEELHAVLAFVLACAGRTADARGELATVEPVVRGRARTPYTGSVMLLLAQTHATLGDTEALVSWLRQMLSGPCSKPFTPASLRLDPRFQNVMERPEVQALLKEFASLDQPQGTATAAPDAKSIAVLPFVNMSTEKESEFFADGMHDEVITALAKVHALKVISRTSVMAFRQTEGRNLKKIAAELGVANVLEGSVQRAGNRVKVIVQLIDARTDQHLWSEIYTEDLTDVFSIQAKLTAEITNALKATLSPEEKSLIARRPTQDLAAYELYVRATLGEENLTIRSSRAEYEQVAALYQQAVAKDPGFALAYARLTRIQGRMYFLGILDPTPARRELALVAMAATQRLAPDAPETHLARGEVAYLCDNDWARALTEYEQAEIGLPNDSFLQSAIATAHTRLGHWQETINHLERTLTLSPRDLFDATLLARYLRDFRRYEKAREVSVRCVGLEPRDAFARENLDRVQFAIGGDLAVYLRAFESRPVASSDPSGLRVAYRRAILARDYLAAERVLADSRLKDLDPTGGLSVGAVEPVALHRALLAFLTGRRESAQRFAEAALADYGQRTWTPYLQSYATLGIALAKACAGRGDEALREGEAAAERALKADAFGGAVGIFDLGLIYLVLDRHEEALSVLKRYVSGPTVVTLNEIRADPFWSRLKDDPRFEEILKSAKPL